MNRVIGLGFSLLVCLALMSYTSSTTLRRCCACFGGSFHQQTLKRIKASKHIYVKSFSLDGRGGKRKKIQHTCVFSKHRTYRTYVADRYHYHKNYTTSNVVMSIYDADSTLLASSLQNDKVAHTLEFECPSTGIYYVRFRFLDNSKSYCGSAMLSVHRERN